ncbi:MAG: carboxypeptidase-like regulatory domain-containing protein [Bacteroidia bacterium]
MADEVTAEYDSTMAELYSISETIFDNLANNLAPFTAYKAKYTDDFIVQLRAQRTAAMGFADEEARNSIFKTKRLELIPLGKTCCKNYQLLKGYIKDSYTDDQQSTAFDAAGQTVYDAASSQNWESVVTLNTEQTAFIDTNKTKLASNLAGEANMPAAFQPKVLTDETAFNTKYAELKVARQTGVDTATKIKANNGLNDAITAINEDSKLVFDDAAHLKLFTFSAVKAIVSPPGSASYKVTVKKHADDTALEGATVVIKSAKGTPISLPTNAQGVAEFKDIDPAGYSVTITKDGYVQEKFNKEVNTGTSARSEVFMEGVV